MKKSPRSHHVNSTIPAPVDADARQRHAELEAVRGRLEARLIASGYPAHALASGRPHFGSIAPGALRHVVAGAFASGALAAFTGAFADRVCIKQATAHELTRHFQQLSPRYRHAWTTQRFRGADGKLIAVLATAPRLRVRAMFILMTARVVEASSPCPEQAERCADLVEAVLGAAAALHQAR